MCAEDKVPAIRFKGFKGFSGEWEENELGDVYKFQYGQYNNNPSDGGTYPVYGANGIIGGYSFFNAQDSIVIGHMGENAGSVLWGSGKHFVTYNGTIATPKISDFIPKFGYYVLCKLNIKKKCGGSGQPFLSYETLEKLIGAYPKSASEQTKIGNYFQQLDTLIALHQKKHDKLLNLKKALLEKLFPKQGAAEPEIRFKGFSGEWEEDVVEKNLNIYSFKPYISKPKQGGSFEIIQQGDKPIIGYGHGSPFEFFKKVVLFGDHTLSLYKPNKPFLVATDGLKILGHHKIISQYFFYTILLKNLPSSEGYKRHFSILKQVMISFPTNSKEQTKIGNLFKQLDTLITQHQTQIKKLNNIKQACLEKMFV